MHVKLRHQINQNEIRTSNVHQKHKLKPGWCHLSLVKIKVIAVSFVRERGAYVDKSPHTHCYCRAIQPVPLSQHGAGPPYGNGTRPQGDAGGFSRPLCLILQ